jgi:hypothetical protein
MCISIYTYRHAHTCTHKRFFFDSSRMKNVCVHVCICACVHCMYMYVYGCMKQWRSAQMNLRLQTPTHADLAQRAVAPLHARARMHTHASRMHTHTSRMHTHASRMHTHAYVNTFLNVCTHTQTYICTCIHQDLVLGAAACSLRRYITCIKSCTHTCTYPYMYIHAYARIYEILYKMLEHAVERWTLARYTHIRKSTRTSANACMHTRRCCTMYCHMP